MRGLLIKDWYVSAGFNRTWLSCALLASALAVFLQVRRSPDALLLLAYSEYIRTMACVVFGAGLIGSALMEDILLSVGTP